MSLGTRGDIEPLLAIGEKLMNTDHEITFAFSEKFRPSFENSQIRFISLGEKFMEVIDSPLAKKAFGGSKSGIFKFIYHLRLGLKFVKIEKDTITRQYNAVKEYKPDLIIHNSIATYPFVWSMDHPGQTVLVLPAPYYFHPANDHPYYIFRKNYGYFLNRLTYKIALHSTAISLKKAMNILKISKKPTKREIKKKLLSVRSIYSISKSLFSKPNYWNNNIEVLGFFERNKSAEWSPPDELTEFLTMHNKLLLISFGSMTNPDPQLKTKIIIEILEKNQIPAILLTGSGGMIIPDRYNKKQFYFSQSLPYDWILQKIYGVVHHGGSGTVHNTLKNGCASLAIPHVFDQFVWNKIIAEKKLGPKGIKIGKLNRQNLEPLILDLYKNRNYKKNAEKISIQMKAESSPEQLINFIINKSS
ncbi:glycosyltransferase [Membranihabitans maritimus]|uniref:glycosyltransferase n=1 Tax=Membranihabitans maritimus TaxID=2904244 RepID=UPI001F207ECB|nr:glycosyltransferase [Membranihabitans maritimus]